MAKWLVGISKVCNSHQLMPNLDSADSLKISFYYATHALTTITCDKISTTSLLSEFILPTKPHDLEGGPVHTSILMFPAEHFSTSLSHICEIWFSTELSYNIFKEHYFPSNSSLGFTSATYSGKLEDFEDFYLKGDAMFWMRAPDSNWHIKVMSLVYFLYTNPRY